MQVLTSLTAKLKVLVVRLTCGCCAGGAISLQLNLLETDME
jgi:hypothetical protein